MRRCFFRDHSDKPCDGPMDRAHLIPKQRIRKLECVRNASAHLRRQIIWHPTVWVWACRKHHADFDNYVFRIPRSAIPEHTEVYARKFDLVWSLDRDYS